MGNILKFSSKLNLPFAICAVKVYTEMIAV